MFDAFLSDWRLIACAEYKTKLAGTIFADANGRFTDGEPVVTSTIASIEHTDGQAIAVTKCGTRYLLCSGKVS